MGTTLTKVVEYCEGKPEGVAFTVAGLRDRLRLSNKQAERVIRDLRVSGYLHPFTLGGRTYYSNSLEWARIERSRAMPV